MHLKWLLAILGLLLAVVALSPAFKSQVMTERALQLAEWTALKDFIEECREEVAAGLESQACLRALNAKIPPPPYVESNVLGRIRRTVLEDESVFNDIKSTSAELVALTGVFRTAIILVLITGVCVLLFLSFRKASAEFTRRSKARKAKAEWYDDLSESSSEFMVDHVLIEPTVRYPPSTPEDHLRQRRIRNHPIYRHATLDAAIHAADLNEIRLRFYNGEDVNQHWPYLIYRLAMSPKAVDLAKRIEVARLCLDFGADIDVLKGWNGQSALLIAIHFGNVAVAKLLIANGANVEFAPADSHLTALHRCVRLAATGSSPEALEIMDMLCRRGADVNRVDRHNETPMQKLLIEAWYGRHDDATVDKLLPIAMCLVAHNAHLTTTLKDSFVVGNPLYELVEAAVLKRSKKSGSSKVLKTGFLQQ